MFFTVLHPLRKLSWGKKASGAPCEKMADELWRECAKWLIRCRVIPPDHRVTWGNAQVIDLATTLRDGVLLCHLLNNLKPGCIDLKEISLRPQMSQFLCLKNIRTFLQTCQSAFDIKSTDLFEPYMLFDCTDFVQVLHTLSKLSNCPVIQEHGLKGFSIQNQVDNHDYYNDDIYKNLEDLANHNMLMSVDELPYEHLIRHHSIHRSREEDVYEDLCYVKFKINESLIFLDPPVEKRDYCIRELVETEKNYIEALNMINRHFIGPLQNIIQPDDRKIIFMNIKDLAEIHNGFHSELVKACTSSNKISQCFLHWKDKFISYGDYCSDLPQAQERIDELCNKNDFINQNVMRCQMEANEGKFKLRDLLSVPMQRVLKYHLLLKELIRNTARTHEDYSGLEKALDSMLDIAQYINEVKRDNETLEIIKDIQASISDLDMPENTELKDYGRLLKDGELKIRSHSENTKFKLRYVFVFDKVMLMCKSSKQAQYSYKEALDLSQFKIEIHPLKSSNRDKWSFSWYLVHRDQRVAYSMNAKTEEMKKKWIEAIEKALENVNPPECNNIDHIFEMHTFEKPRYCDHCEKLLRGVFYQGYYCSTCNIGVHKGCIAHVRSCGAPCLPPRPADNRLVLRETLESINNVERHPISLCTAKQSHQSTMSGYLSFEKGDVIHVLKKLSSTKWLGRLVKTAQEGWVTVEHVEEQPLLTQNKRISYEVPPSFGELEPPASPKQLQQPYVNLNLEEYPWFANKLSKETATLKLEKLPEGTFMVRISERQKGNYAISIKHENKVKHMRVQVDCTQQNQNLFYLSESKYFKSIVELVKWYQDHTLADSFTGLNITLMKPYKQVLKGTVPIGYAIVNYDFSATSANMLSLKKGDRVAILCKRGGDKGWWKGQINNEVGFFPMLYVTELET